MWKFNGTTFTDDEIKKYSEDTGMSVDEYVDRFEVKKDEEEEEEDDKKDKEKKEKNKLGLNTPIELTSTPKPQNISLDSLGNDVRTGTVEPTVDSKDIDPEKEEKRIKKQKIASDLRQKQIISDYNKIEVETRKKLQGQGVSEENIVSRVKNQQTLFMHDISSFDRKIIRKEGSVVLDSLIQNREADIKMGQDNMLAIQEIHNMHDESVENGVPYSNKEIVEANKKIEALAKINEGLVGNILTNSASIEDKEGFLDNFKRSYSDWEMLGNVVANAATDVAIAGVKLAPRLALPKGGLALDALAPLQEKALAGLIDIKSIIGKNIADNLAKPMEATDGKLFGYNVGKTPPNLLKTPNEGARFIADALINFGPSGAAALTGAGAMPLFFAMGFGGRYGEFEMDQQNSPKIIAGLEEALKVAEDPKDKQEIENQLEFYNDALNKDDMTKVGVSMLYGGSEVFTEYFTTLKLVKGMKAANISKALLNYYKKPAGFVNAVKTLMLPAAYNTIKAPVLEGLVGEGGNLVLGTLADVYVNEKNISYLDGLRTNEVARRLKDDDWNTVTNGMLIGSGFATSQNSMIASAALMDGISTKYEKNKVRKIVKEMTLLGDNLLTVTDPNSRMEILKSIRTKAKEAGLEGDFIASNFLKLGKEEKLQVFEKNRQLIDINNRYRKIASASDITDESIEITRKDLKEEFDRILGEKQKILKSKEIVVGDLEIDKGLEAGDFIMRLKQLTVNLNAAKQYNNMHGKKYFARQGGITEIEIPLIQEFLEYDVDSYTLQDGTKINKKDAINIINEYENVPNATGVYTSEDGERTSFTFIDRAINGGEAATPIHELFHAFSEENGFTKEQFEIIEKDLLNLVDTKLKDSEIDQEQYDYIKNKLKRYDNNPDKAEELFNIIGDAKNKQIIQEEDISFLSSLSVDVKSFLGNFMEKEDSENFGIDTAEQAWKLVDFLSRDVLKNKKGVNIKPGGDETKKEGKTTKLSLGKETLFENIQNLVPSNIKTQEEFNNFIRDPRNNKPLFEAITNNDGSIQKYVRKNQTSQEQGDKTLENIQDRILGFNPEAVRKTDGGKVGIEAFTERVMSDAMFSKMDANKSLAKESEKAKQETSIDNPDATTQLADDVNIDSKIDNTPKQQTSKLRRDLGIKQGDDIYNSVKQTAKEIFGKDLDAVDLKKLKSIVNKKARGSDIFKDVAKLMGTEKAIDPQFLNKNILNILKDLSVSDLVKLERGTKGEKIFTKTGPRLGPIAARKAVNNGLLPKNTNINSGPRVSEKLPVTLEQAKEFFTQKRKAGLVGVIAENLISDAAPSITQEINITAKRRAEILAVLDRNPNLKFNLAEDLKGKPLGKLLESIEKDGLAEVFTAPGKISGEYDEDIKNIDSELVDIVYDLYEKAELKDPNAILYGARIELSNDVISSDKKTFKEAGNFAKDEDQQRDLVEDIKVLVNKLGKEVTDFLGFDVFGFTLKSGLDPASRKELRSSVDARKKVLKENKIRKEKGEELELVPKKVFSDAAGKYFPTLQKIKEGVMEIASPADIKKILPFARKMNKAFPLFQKFSNKNAKGIIKGIFAESSLDKKIAMLIELQPEIEAANAANIELATYFSQTINELYRDGKIKASSVLRLYQLQTSATGGLRALTRLTDITLENKPQLYNIKGEHLAPNANTMAGLAIATLNPKISLEESNALITQEYNNHNQWITDDALTKVVDDKLGKTSTLNRNRLFALPLSNLKNVYTYQGGSTIKELIIQESAKLVKRKNNEILPKDQRLKDNYNNTNVLTKASLIDQSNLKQEKKFSLGADLSKGMNDIIQAKAGIASEKTYSRVKAEVVGANKGRFDFFIPPSAEDFVGLLYKTLGKGKLGDSQMAWYKAHLLNPFARAMDNISRDRVALQNDFKALKKELKGIPKTLKKKVPGEGFTQEQAVRSYIWDKQGMTIPGLAGTDIKTLVDFVTKNPDLVTFANQLIAMQKGDQYAAPGEGWLAGNITTDLMEGINTTKRAKYLEVWQTNANQIFSESNLSKLEAAYGKDYRVALENILQRMKTGKNRSFGGDNLTGRVTDWLTNSIGAIMFFNTRSAVLQTISAINFVNFKDNNIFAAGKAFANQPQYWKDFKTLFNSDFLLERRDGLKLNVNEADIADMAKRGGVRGVISELLKLGFLPTQLADSFAIASGGSTFYRNRVKALEKQGMSKTEAETKAFQDFRETAEESQQSSRPDRISMQQAGPLGRIILAFANTPAQYARIIKKAGSDLKNGRGDAKTNISKILYYGVAQNLIFNALQQALFGLAFGDEEEEDKVKEKKYVNVANGMADSLLRGMGLGGAIFSVLKNTALRLNQESDKKRPKYQDVLVKEILQISPPISSKVGKLKAAGRSYSWNKEEMMTKGWSIDNPAYLAAGQVIAATTNIPLDRAFKKIDNIRNASNSDLEAWQRIASAAGWSAWELGINNESSKSAPKLTSEQKLIKLTKAQQVDSLLSLGITKKQIRNLKLESDRVRAILNPKSIKIEKLSEKDSLFGLNKKQQVEALLKLGLTKKEIRALKLEKNRVSRIMSDKN